MEQKLAVKLRKFNRICPIKGYKEDSIRIGAPVIVKTDRGEEFGTIISFVKNVPEGTSDVSLKKVLRYATENDLKTANFLPEKEAKAYQLANEKIENMNFQ